MATDKHFSQNAGMVKETISSLAAGASVLITLPLGVVGANIQVFDSNGKFQGLDRGSYIGLVAASVGNTGDDDIPVVTKMPGGAILDEAGTLRFMVTAGDALNGTDGQYKSMFKYSGGSGFATVSTALAPTGSRRAFQAIQFTASTTAASATGQTSGKTLTGTITIGTTVNAISVTGAPVVTIGSLVAAVASQLSGGTAFFVPLYGGEDNGAIVVEANAYSALQTVTLNQANTIFASLAAISAGADSAVAGAAGTSLAVGLGFQAIFNSGVDGVTATGDYWDVDVSPVALDVQFSEGTWAAVSVGSDPVKVSPAIIITNNSGDVFTGSLIASFVL